MASTCSRAAGVKCTVNATSLRRFSQPSILPLGTLAVDFRRGARGLRVERELVVGGEQGARGGGGDDKRLAGGSGVQRDTRRAVGSDADPVDEGALRGPADQAQVPWFGGRTIDADEAFGGPGLFGGAGLFH